jgi:hypothetical protein
VIQWVFLDLLASPIGFIEVREGGEGGEGVEAEESSPIVAIEVSIDNSAFSISTTLLPPTSRLSLLRPTSSFLLSQYAVILLFAAEKGLLR